MQMQRAGWHKGPVATSPVLVVPEHRAVADGGSGQRCVRARCSNVQMQEPANAAAARSDGQPETLPTTTGASGNRSDLCVGGRGTQWRIRLPLPQRCAQHMLLRRDAELCFPDLQCSADTIHRHTALMATLTMSCAASRCGSGQSAGAARFQPFFWAKSQNLAVFSRLAWPALQRITTIQASPLQAPGKQAR
ncbi:hypothetical protein BDV95DRAFT_204883 [Massariosphaeria phaeospora]|uniref:Uncharacterized protein n=1 Tax=Massariosphaeria phaeospora TaxID=100035 RepID=A0A7C8M3L9_9PLEO|nr:hypothetical protein BDV95DRAFT_204883 [Massariosphaeria phaeospora]